jgi:peptide/nickel transport system substrate-binding protein
VLLCTAVIVAAASTACGRAAPRSDAPGRATLRIGAAHISIDTFIKNFTIEGLTAVGDNGRVKPWLAKDVSVSDDGLSILLSLRPGVRFHDGSALPAQLVADTLRTTLPSSAGPAYADVSNIEAISNEVIAIRLSHPSQFVLESLDAAISKPGAATVGTGPFMADKEDAGPVLKANPAYYLGAPAIPRLELQLYQTERAAWADMLRDQLDMVYEVGREELDSLQSSTTTNVFSAVRRYQFAVIFNLRSQSLRSPAARRALNIAIDRDALIRNAMGGHGVPSSGPVWPAHWAAQPALPKFEFDPSTAAALLTEATGRPAAPGTPTLRFTCLVGPDAERVALVVKQQLQAIGVDMVLEELSRDEFIRAASDGRFDAIISSMISAPSIARTYLWWDSHGPSNHGGYSDAKVDSAFAAINRARSDGEYRDGVMRLQQAILSNPPAIFLAWDEAGRAVSTRFDVPSQPGTDIIRTLHLWRPVAGGGSADKN